MKRVPQAKASKPVTSQAHSSKGATKGHKTRKHRNHEHESDDRVANSGDHDMATSFLQYCTICDKQILVPNSSYLYCSEHCRRIDAMPSSRKPDQSSALSLSYNPGPQHPSIFDPHSLSSPRFVPKLKPTPRPGHAARIPPNYHTGSIDLDPTEWKPSETSSDSDDDHGTARAPTAVTQSEPGNKSIKAAKDLSKYRKVRAGGGQATRALPSLSRASTATLSSSSSSASSRSETSYSFISTPLVSVPTTSLADAGTLGLEAVNLSSSATARPTSPPQPRSRYEKRAVEVGVTRSAARGSLKKLLGGGAGDGV